MGHLPTTENGKGDWADGKKGRKDQERIDPRSFAFVSGNQKEEREVNKQFGRPTTEDWLGEIMATRQQ